MAHISMICGDQPARVGEHLNNGVRAAHVSVGNWDQLLRRFNGAPFQRPPDSVVFADGGEALREIVGDDGMRAVLYELDPSEHVTVVQVVD